MDLSIGKIKKFSQNKKSPFYGNVKPQSLRRRAVLLVYSDGEKPVLCTNTKSPFRRQAKRKKRDAVYRISFLKS